MQKALSCANVPHGASKTRKLYTAQLVIRCLILAACILILIFDPEQTEVLEGWNFFRSFTPLHLLWLTWMLDMLWQLVPVKKRLVIALGSQKHFKFRFQPPEKENFSYQALRRHIIEITKAAYKVFAIWAAVVAVISMLRVFDVLNDDALFMITIVFYVCDLCVDLVSVPADRQGEMLHDMPDLQLGSSDDVFPDADGQRVLFPDTAADGICGLADLGAVHYDVPRAVLGEYECRTPLYQLH